MALLIFWFFVEIVRLNLGYKANIDESFPDLVSFDLLTLVFSIPPQVLQVVGKQTMPIDKSTFIVYIFFAILEVITSFIVMRNIVKRKAAVYYLHNTATESIKSEFHNGIKTSKQIKDEVNVYLQEKKDKEELMRRL